MYTVKQLSKMAGVSVRTLHFYDEIGLLKPSSIGKNGYRYYDDEALFSLQQILFFRGMDLDLRKIKEILEDEGFDRVAALQTHRQALQEKIDRLKTLINTIDVTIMHLLGEVKMSKKNIFQGFSEEKQKQYELEVAQQYGEENVKKSVQRWNNYTDEQKDQIKQEGSAIYLGLAENMDRGPESPEVQALLARWHQHIRYFYEPSLEILRGLGNGYNDHPDFNAFFTAIDPALPEFLQKSITCYVDRLENQ